MQSMIDLLIKKPVLLRTSFSFLFYLPFAKRDDEKKKKEKNFRKYLEDMLKSSYLCIRFLKRKSDSKRSDLWIIYINNTSSTRARLLHLSEVILGIKKEPSSNLYIGNLRTFNKPSVLNRAKSPVAIPVITILLQWRVWSWLRMNASYRLNTCKSRGSMV